MIARRAFVVRPIAHLLLEMQVGDGHQVEPLRSQIAHHLLEVRKLLAVDGEGTVAVAATAAGG